MGQSGNFAIENRKTSSRRAVFKLPNYKITKLLNSLNAQRLTPFLAAQNPVKNRPRNEYCREQVRQQTEGECDRKSLHRTGAEDEQDRRRNDRRDVGINDRSEEHTSEL